MPVTSCALLLEHAATLELLTPLLWKGTKKLYFYQEASEQPLLNSIPASRNLFRIKYFKRWNTGGRKMCH